MCVCGGGGVSNGVCECVCICVTCVCVCVYLCGLMSFKCVTHLNLLACAKCESMIFHNDITWL